MYGSGPNLKNGGEYVFISLDGVELDRANFGSSIEGVSHCLPHPYTADNNVTTSWKKSTTAWAGGDKGSPGASNEGNCQ